MFRTDEKSPCSMIYIRILPMIIILILTSFKRYIIIRNVIYGTVLK